MVPLATEKWKQPDYPQRIHHVPAWIDGGEKWDEPPAEEKHEDEDAPYLASGDDVPPDSECSDVDLTDKVSDEPRRVAEHPAETANGEDVWFLNDEVLVRYHRVPRDTLFVPEDATCPVPNQFLDITRVTITDLPDPTEARIEDFWCETSPEGIPPDR